MPSSSQRDRLPFEPRQNKKKTRQKTAPTEAVTPTPEVKTKTQKAKLSTAIPDEVSKRMARRMAVFCGIPTACAFLCFFIFYWVKSHDWYDIPTPAVVITTFSLFALGFVGLSYGVISASWDSERVGSRFGWEEFTLNFGRMSQAWRARKEAIKR